MTQLGKIEAATNIYTVAKTDGAHLSTATTYISGTGTVGTSGTAMTVISRTLAANSLTQVGDRTRIRAYFFANSAAPIVASVVVGISGSGVTTSHTTHSGAGASGLNECWLHYIDATHANIIEQEQGMLGVLSAPNVAGFSWTSAQEIAIKQDGVGGNFLTVYGVVVDILPKGTV